MVRRRKVAPEGSTNENAFFNSILEDVAGTISRSSTNSAAPKHFNPLPVRLGLGNETRRSSGPSRSPPIFGGTRNPMIVCWPAKDQRQRAGCAASSHHVVDIMPTLARSRRRARRPTSSTAFRRSRSMVSAWPTLFADARAADRRKDAGVRDGRQSRHVPERLDCFLALLRAVAAGPYRLRHR